MQTLSVRYGEVAALSYDDRDGGTMSVGSSKTEELRRLQTSYAVAYNLGSYVYSWSWRKFDFFEKFVV